MSAAIDLTGVDKVYKGKIHALRGVDMRVERGEVFGLLGPNGAGKSTLVKILMTVIRPTLCAGTMLDHPIGDKSVLARVGYLPEHHRFPDYLTGEQVVDFFGALSGTPRDERRRRVGELLDLVGMSRWAKTRLKQYSKGMRQRIGIAQALVNDPDLVLLDEPTDGVDPEGRRDIRGVVREIRDRGKTVMVNSHLLSELEMICDRVAIMVQGQVRRQGTLDDLTSAQRRYEIELAAEPSAIRSALPDLNRQTAPTLTLQDRTILLGSERAEDAQPVIDRLRGAGLVIRSVRPFRPSLEDLFMDAVSDAQGPGAAPDSRRPATERKARSTGGER